MRLMNACSTLLIGLCCTCILLAQDLASCGDGYTIDLSIGYTVTGQGLSSCGCSSETKDCELVHIVLKQVRDNDTKLLSCPNISLTERWWRELKDLVDIYDPTTCQEYPESDTHPDRYELKTDHLEAGDTLSILVCKVNSFDNNIIELSASPSKDCDEAACPPTIDCPAEFKLRKGFDCGYTLPDFRSGVTLTDQCQSPTIYVTDNYTIMQVPPAGTMITANSFVEIRVYDDEGALVTTCDIYVTLAEDTPPVMSNPLEIPDMPFGQTLPTFEDIIAHDTLEDGTIVNIDVVTSMHTGDIDPCQGYPVTYRWAARDTCGNTAVREQTFNVLPDAKAPVFVSVPVDIDTILAGEPFPLLVDLIAVNEDGSAAGVQMTKDIDPYTPNTCQGFPVTYRWTATDSCANMAEITKSFFVKPVNEPPLFITQPKPIENISGSQEFPIPENLQATNGAGFQAGIQVVHSIDPYIQNNCNPYQVTYRWTAQDSCSNQASTAMSFMVIPDSIDFSDMPAMENLNLMVEGACEKSAAIALPINVDDYNGLIIQASIFDDNWNLLAGDIYNEAATYNFEAGTSHIVYTFRDECDRSTADTVTISAADAIPPLLDCNANQQIIISDFATCSAVVNWSAPGLVDNCPGSTLTQVAGPASGSSLPTGQYEIIYEATDASGNQSSCSFTIDISAAPAEGFNCKPISSPLDTSCNASISRSFIISQLGLSCNNNLGLVIKADQDTLTGEVVQLGDHLDKAITYTVCDPVSGLCCSERIIIRDTIAPVLTCAPPIEIACYSDIDAYRPVLTECNSVTWRISQEAVSNQCINEDILSIINTTYTATDEAGNKSNTCTQQYIIKYAKIDSLDLLGQIQFPSDTILSCDNIDIYNTTSVQTGFPSINGKLVDPNNPICGLDITYTDEVLFDIGCGKSFSRSWQIIEDRCHAEFAIVSGTQYIKIIDTIAPVVNAISSTITIDTETKECQGYLFRPQLEVTDNCEVAEEIDITYRHGDITYDYYTPIPLLAGDNQLIIIATDPCGNIGRDTIQVVVNDPIRPVAVCYDDNVVTLSGGVAKLTYRSVDAGTYDNCELASVKIRREESICIPQDSIYGDEVHFCCEDVGKKILISLQAIDHAGNINVCHSFVIVQDKTAPIITCPSDLILSCEADIAPSDDQNDPYGYLLGRIEIGSSIVPIGLDPQYVISSSGALINGSVRDECLEDITVTVVTNATMNNCGIGTIKRTFTAIDKAGNTTRPCTQTITITGGETLDTSLIQWPESEINIDACSSTHDISPEAIGRPITYEKTCTLFGVSYDDTYYKVDGNNNGTCSKIIRSWTIINWCDPSDQTGVTKYQTIKISDNEAPIIHHDCDTLIYLKTASIDCEQIPIVLSLNVEDNCIPLSQLEITVAVDLDQDGSVDYNSTNIIADSTSIHWQDTLVAGDHTITWTITDLCGNTSTCSQDLIIEDSKPPAPYAQGINLSMPVEGYVDIWASDLSVKANDPCGNQANNRISLVGESFEEAGDVIRLSCDHIGETLIRVYAFRYLADGSTTYDFTTVAVDLQNHNNHCPETPTNTEVLTTSIGGNVKTSYGVLLPYTEVFLQSEEDQTMTLTDDAGWYGQDLPVEDIYKISPVKEDIVRRGLSTRDAIIIQRHIIGLTTLTSPWDLLTADVTRNHRISASDIIELRKVLLGKESKMEEYPSWTFLREDYNFIDASHAHEEPIDYNSYFLPADGNQRIDFIGIKVGDIDKSVTLSNLTAKKRSTVILEASYTSNHIHGTDTIHLHLTKGMNISGYQMSLDLGVDLATIRDVIVPDGFDYDMVTDNQVLQISAHNAQGQQASPESPIISIIIDQKNRSKPISIKNDELLDTEIYDADLNTYNIQLHHKELTINEESDHGVVITPNPFHLNTTLSFHTQSKGEAILTIYDINGASLYRQVKDASKGPNLITIKADAVLKNGVLFYSLITPNGVYRGKLVKQ